MGRRLRTRVTFNGTTSEGEAHLESDHLTFGGAFQLKVAFAEIQSLVSGGDTLLIGFDAGNASFELGEREAAKWIEHIRNPKSVLGKLGVKPTDVVAVIGIDDAEFHERLLARLQTAPHAKPPRGANVIFYGADSPAALARLEKLRANLAPNGAIWVVSRKGKQATVKDTDVMAAGKKAGLVDTKVVAFSPTHTALKLVIPLADRPRPPQEASARRSS